MIFKDAEHWLYPWKCGLGFLRQASLIINGVNETAFDIWTRKSVALCPPRLLFYTQGGCGLPIPGGIEGQALSNLI